MDITFADKDSPELSTVVGQLTVTGEDLSELDVQFLKGNLDVMAKVVRLWITFGKNPNAMLDGMQGLIEQVTRDNPYHGQLTTTFKKKSRWGQRIVCNGCGFKARMKIKEIPRFCPGCGKTVTGIS